MEDDYQLLSMKRVRRTEKVIRVIDTEGEIIHLKVS